jgi:hypothetical protein
MNLNHPPDLPESVGDQAQVHRIVRQVAMAYREIDGPLKPDIPAPLKWAGGIVAALFTAGIATLAFWLVTSVSQMQVTLARMDERLGNQADDQQQRFTDIERRVSRLESFHETGARP